MKKKILSLCVVLALAVTAIVGGTLAYFSDTDNQTNVFTTGNVEIDLWEDFSDNDVDEGVVLAELTPATTVKDGVLQNSIEKEIYVTNTGSEDAFVRVHIAIPTILVEANREFDANDGVLKFAYEDNAVEGKWDWSNEDAADDYAIKSNTYDLEIENIDYTVYVVTYTTALETDETTEDAISRVWMDSETTNEDVAEITTALGDEWNIFVAAEGTQAAGFDDAYEALNTAFGTPGAYDVDWTSVVGDTFVNND